MANTKTKKTEKVVDEVVETKVEAKVVEEPKKEKSSNFKEDGTYKLDLTKTKEEGKPVRVEEKEDEVLKVSTKEKEVVETKEEEEIETPVLEEITDEKQEGDTVATNIVKTDEVEIQKEEIKDNTPEMELPKNIRKVVDFMNETGGTLEDYVRLNADYSKTDDGTLLQEYYRQTKPHLLQDERDFLIEDNFKFDDEVDEERDVKRKKLAYKEAVAEARNHLEQMKGKYYEDIKMGSKLPPEQQKAIDFFDRYNKEQGEVKKLTLQQQTHYNKKTNEVFNDEFKGFDFNVGDKKYRYNIKDVAANKDAQKDVMNVFSDFVNKDNLLTNAKGYHKSLFAARNPDAIANHFYQQGKADAVSEITQDSKNINMDPRKSDASSVDSGGVKYKVISGDNSSKLRFKFKN